jgi:hypothetical protein
LTARYLFWHRSHNAIVGETPATILDHPSNVDDKGLRGRQCSDTGNVDNRSSNAK